MPEPPQSTTRPGLAQELLRYKMEEYWEDFHCAGWLMGLEFLLRQGAEAAESPENAHLRQLSQEFRQLGEIAGGWWVYEDETRPGERGPLSIPMERWQKRLRERRTSQPQLRPLGLYAGQIQVP